VLTLSPTIRIYLCVRPADFRCGMDRLACLARERVEEDPLNGHLFVFRNRRGNRLKVLYWDRNGWALWYKRLERGRFHFPDAGGAESRTISPAAFQLLLGGVMR
jgi:transposase